MVVPRKYGELIRELAEAKNEREEDVRKEFDLICRFNPQVKKAKSEDMKYSVAWTVLYKYYCRQEDEEKPG